MRYNNKNVILPEHIIDYLCFEANTAGSTVALSNTSISPNIEYSRDKNTWSMWDYSALTLKNVGDKIYMRGSNPNGIGQTETNVSKFIMTGSISVKGNIMTLIDKVGKTLIIPSNYCFRNLFRQCTSLVEANISLPANTLTNYCYDNMFRDCTNLIKAPVLVATNANYTGCYRSLFNGCNALNKIITYAQTIGANSTELWVDKVAATGDFYNLGGANYQSGASGIPSGWTVHTSL